MSHVLQLVDRSNIEVWKVVIPIVLVIFISGMLWFRKKLNEEHWGWLEIKCWVGIRTERSCENRTTFKCILCKLNIKDYDPNNNREISKGVRDD